MLLWYKHVHMYVHACVCVGMCARACALCTDVHVSMWARACVLHQHQQPTLDLRCPIRVAIKHLKCGWSLLRCAVNMKHTPDFKDLYEK